MKYGCICSAVLLFGGVVASAMAGEVDEGWDALKLRNPSQAKVHFQNAITANPDDLNAHLGMVLAEAFSLWEDPGTTLNNVAERFGGTYVPTIRVNFQPAAAPPPGFQADTGDAYDPSRRFGWDQYRGGRAFKRDTHPNPLLDTGIAITDVATWRADVQPGEYEVIFSVGDPLYARNHQKVTVAGDPGDERTFQVIDMVEVEEDHQFIGGGDPQQWQGSDWSWSYALPFTFPFYGGTYSTMAVSSNGYLELGVTAVSEITGPWTDYKIIAPCGAHLRTDMADGDIFIHQPNASSVAIRWKAVTYEDREDVNFEVVLLSDGRIRFNYGECGDVEATVGISAGDGVRYILSDKTDEDLHYATSSLFRPVGAAVFAKFSDDFATESGQIILTLDGTAGTTCLNYVILRPFENYTGFPEDIPHTAPTITEVQNAIGSEVIPKMDTILHHLRQIEPHADFEAVVSQEAAYGVGGPVGICDVYALDTLLTCFRSFLNLIRAYELDVDYAVVQAAQFDFQDYVRNQNADLFSLKVGAASLLGAAHDDLATAAAKFEEAVNLSEDHPAGMLAPELKASDRDMLRLRADEFEAALNGPTDVLVDVLDPDEGVAMRVDLAAFFASPPTRDDMPDWRVANPADPEWDNEIMEMTFRDPTFNHSLPLMTQGEISGLACRGAIELTECCFLGANTILLSWQPDEFYDDFDHYEIYRSTVTPCDKNRGTATLIASIPWQFTLSFTDVSVEPEREYYYRVYGCMANGVIIRSDQRHVRAGELQETTSMESTMALELFSRNASLSGGTLAGDLTGTFNFTHLDIVGITSGSFAGEGFSNGEWTMTVEGRSYGGEWKGVWFSAPSQEVVHLRGTVSGSGASGIVEGWLTESSPGSGSYDRYHATWRLGRLGDQEISAVLKLEGILSYGPPVVHPLTQVYVLQSNVEGATSGDYSEPISCVLTHLRVDDFSSPFHGEGFSIISYASRGGSGSGWTRDTLASPGKVAMDGLFTEPLGGIVSGTLEQTGETRALLLSVRRIDLASSPAPNLIVEVWGPQRVSPGQTVTYIVGYRNAGRDQAEDMSVVAILPRMLKYLSSSRGGVYIPPHSAGMLFYPLGTVLPGSGDYIGITVEIMPGLPPGQQIPISAFPIPTSELPYLELPPCEPDGFCNCGAGEIFYTCPEDCSPDDCKPPDPPYCGDGFCDPAEALWCSDCGGDSFTSDVITAHDPNIKYGPEGNVQPGQPLYFKVEFENEGEGIAFGVYLTDTLDEGLDDSTLQIGPVISAAGGWVIAGPGTYDPASRTITWFAGEVWPGEGGYADFTVNVRSDIPEGTEIINFATVYFPTVPEATRTNAIVSVVPYPKGAIRTLLKDGDKLAIEWEPFGDGRYTIQTTTDLSSGLWADATGEWPTSARWHTLDVTGTEQMFIRVEAEAE